MQLSGFNGRIALVTGAAGGIGAALVGLLRDCGCTVVATDRFTPDVFSPEPDIEGARVYAKALDVTDSTAVNALVDEVERDMGRLILASTSPACCSRVALTPLTTTPGDAPLRSTPTGCFTCAARLPG